MTVGGRDVLRQIDVTTRAGVVELDGRDVCRVLPHAATDPQYGLFNSMALIPRMFAALKEMDADLLAMNERLNTLSAQVTALTKDKDKKPK